MNRSYSKIRHIQEANQRLEKRLLNEQSVTVTTTMKQMGNEDDYLMKSVNIYGDKENKSYISTSAITNFKPKSDGVYEMELDAREPLYFSCLKPNQFNEDERGAGQIFYSNQLADKLNKDFCMTNKSGTQVPKADFASNNQSKTTPTA